MATSELAADSLYPILAEESIADKLGYLRIFSIYYSIAAAAKARTTMA
jgi:hypothetical protein